MKYNKDYPIFKDTSDLEDILEGKLKKQPQINSVDEFPDPYEMRDMEKAVNIFMKAVANNEKIKLVCDSDMDGLGTYLLWYNFFSHFLYGNIEIIITDRSKGYGFIPEYIDETTKLYITSDNGITSIEATEAAKESGASVIICDHHQPDLEAGLPKADAIIDPWQPGDTFPYKDISGTFVLWFFLKAIADKLNLSINIYEEFLPELAITTLSDVMPIDRHINRFVVKDFVNKFKDTEWHRMYLQTFKNEITDEPTAETFSFSLIPMINATQRMTKADHGAMFLVANDNKTSLEWFNYLKSLNDARKKRQQDLLNYIEKYYKEYIKQPFIVIPGKFQKEYKGVLGVIAGNLAKKYNKPAIVLNYNAEEKEYSGSGRSVGQLNILDVLRDNPYVKQVGGHTAALGITVTEENFEKFYAELQKEIIKIPDDILEPAVEVLGEVPINFINTDFYEVLSKFEPYGHEFHKPIFITKGIIKTARLIGKNKNHLVITITDKNNILDIEGIKFFENQLPGTGKEYLIFFKFDLDQYHESKVKLNVEYLLPVP